MGLEFGVWLVRCTYIVMIMMMLFLVTKWCYLPACRAVCMLAFTLSVPIRNSIRRSNLKEFSWTITFCLVLWFALFYRFQLVIKHLLLTAITLGNIETEQKNITLSTSRAYDIPNWLHGLYQQKNLKMAGLIAPVGVLKLLPYTRGSLPRILLKTENWPNLGMF